MKGSKKEWVKVIGKPARRMKIASICLV